jgi:carbon storage regulator
MLILTRRIGETIKIGTDIQVAVLGISGAQVRLGIEAPKHVSIHRLEVAERIAAGVPPPRSRGAL